VRGEEPNVTQEPVSFVDCTPDDDYPLRILRAHRANADVRWEVSGLPEERRHVYDLMNADCEKRAAILDRAIAALERAR
jgi:hypothetical protein